MTANFLRISSLALAIGLATLTGARAADAIYAPGSRIGLVPMQGLQPSKSFSGFEDADKGVRVIALEMPESAYNSIEAALLQKDAVGALRPERFETAIGPAVLTREKGQVGGREVEQFSMIAKAGKAAALVTVLVPADAAKDYSEDAIKRMFATVALRPEVPVAEQLALLPFNLNDLGGFKTVRTLDPGQTVVLSDGDHETALENPVTMLITITRGGPGTTEERGRFARQLMESVPGLKSGRITSSEPMRVGGQQGYETRMDATTSKDVEITMVQWLRFGTGGFIRLIGAAPRDEWSKVFPRLRAVRDGIEPK